MAIAVNKRVPVSKKKVSLNNKKNETVVADSKKEKELTHIPVVSLFTGQLSELSPKQDSYVGMLIMLAKNNKEVKPIIKGVESPILGKFIDSLIEKVASKKDVGLQSEEPVSSRSFEVRQLV